MSELAKFELCVLWESELRIAARLCKQIAETGSDDPQWPKLAADGLRACMVALDKLTDDRALVLIGSPEVYERLEKSRAKPSADVTKE